MKELPLTYRGLVYPWHCDHMGHMNVMWYTGKFDEATWNFAALFGLTAAYMKQENKGMVAVEQKTLYKRELLAGTGISIRSGMIETGEKKIKFFHEMTNDQSGELAAVTFLTGVHIDTILRRACALPEEVRKQAEAFITGYRPEA